MWPLQRASNESLADVLDHGLLRRYVPVLPLNIIRRFASPDIENLIDRFKKHGVSVGVELTEKFAIRQASAGADYENQASIEYVIEHRYAGRNGGRMGIGHIDRAGAKPDLLGGSGDPRQERDAGGDVLGLVGDVFADVSLGKPQFVGQQESLAVFLQGQLPILFDRMDRHRKETQIHCLLLPADRF